MLVEFVGQSLQDGGNRAAEPSRLINFYREPLGGKAVLKSVLGQELLVDFGTVFMRDIERIGSKFYAATGGKLRSLTEGGVKAVLGDINDSEETTIDGNNGDVTVVAGGAYYLWNGTTLSTPAAGQFSNFGSCCYIGGYTILTERNGRQFCWSDLLDASTLPALNFATAEARDDSLLRCFAIRGNLWLFKEQSAEIWYATGQSGAEAFLRLSGGVFDIGLKGYSLLAGFDGGAFFVGDDNVAYITQGSAPTPVSAGHSGVTYSIENETPDHCFFYEDGDHKFCVIAFRDRPSWCFDITTGEWHERASGKDGDWGVANAVKGASSWFCGADDGKVYRMTRNNTDAARELQRTAVSKALYLEQSFSVDLLELFGRVGFSDLGRDAQCWIRLSRDRGMTWGPEKWISLGDLGEYGKKLRKRSLGWCEDSLVVELNISDPAEVSFDAVARVEVS